MTNISFNSSFYLLPFAFPILALSSLRTGSAFTHYAPRTSWNQAQADRLFVVRRNPSLFARQSRRRKLGSDADSPDTPSVEVDRNSDSDDDEEQEWLSDRELLRRAAQTPGGEALTNRDAYTLEKFQYAGTVDESEFALPEESSISKKKKSVYTEEEEELIRLMGGKSNPSANEEDLPSQREEGYLGDSTLLDISHDYAVPICYIADVLLTWGVPPPIDIHSRLGDLVTGEQAFALCEALNTLDNTQLNERYSYDDIMTLCDEYDLELREVFEFCMKEGYNLPFGVRTCLRVEQEEELLRVLAGE